MAQGRPLQLIRDQEIESIIRLYATPLFQAAGLDPRAISVYLVQDPSLNAFVMGGQNLFIHTGLLMTAEDPLEVIGVIAHETGHIAGGHVAQRIGAAQDASTTMLVAQLLGILGASIYPRDEPPLPAELHVHRALGGPRASAVLAALAGLLTLATRRMGGVPFMLAALMALENLFIFTLGAFLPMPFMETDGSTLLRHREGLRKQMVVIQE